MERILYATCMALFVPGLTGFAPSPPAVAAPDVQLEALMRGPCNSSCTTCGMTSLSHTTGEGDSHGFGGHGCITANTSCDDHTCGKILSSLMELRGMLDAARIDRLMAELPSTNIEFVPERGVIQIKADCGSVIAQFPATPADLR